MIHPWVHNEIARQRHQDLLAAAERYRLGRNVRVRNTDRQTASCKNAFAAFFRRATENPCKSEV
jgi:hypothetical protein